MLILDTSVSGGAGSIEGVAATGLGRGADVIDGATWSGMTTAQFTAYDAIILGDAYCPYGCPGVTGPWIGPAEANAGTWAAAVTGNVIVIGTDPVLHGRTLVTENAVKYAVDSAAAGKTGAYISLGCYYHGVGALTPVPVLSGFGSFTATGVPGCFDSSHIVATHPALTGLTDAMLSGWGCSVHNAFDGIAACFLPLAIALTGGSGAMSFPDGSTGIPYIVARGEGLTLISSSMLSPASATNEIGTPHTFTAHVEENNPARATGGC